MEKLVEENNSNKKKIEEQNSILSNADELSRKKVCGLSLRILLWRENLDQNFNQ